MVPALPEQKNGRTKRLQIILRLHGVTILKSLWASWILLKVFLAALLWKELLRFPSRWFSYSFIHTFRCLQLRSCPYRENSHRPRSPMRTEGLQKNAVRPGSARGLFTTLLLLPQCHASFSTVTSTLARVDPSLVGKVWRSNPLQVSPPHLLPHSM